MGKPGRGVIVVWFGLVCDCCVGLNRFSMDVSIVLLPTQTLRLLFACGSGCWIRVCRFVNWLRVHKSMRRAAAARLTEELGALDLRSRWVCLLHHLNTRSTRYKLLLLLFQQQKQQPVPSVWPRGQSVGPNEQCGSISRANHFGRLVQHIHLCELWF